MTLPLQDPNGSTMELLHVALRCSDASLADRFYREVLELETVGEKSIAASLAASLFGVERELKIVNYAGAGVHFEIFIDRGPKPHKTGVDHVCLAVGDLERFLEKCRQNRVPVRQIPRGDGALLTFIRDFDGNLFEIKPRSNQ